jgi:DNA-binding transcriptional LysR family regulator
MVSDYLNEKRLRYFFTTTIEGSIRRAADALNVEASVISRQIQALEAELGVKLLKRHGRGVVPTEAGNLVFEHCKQRRSIEENLRTELDSLNGPLRGKIRVALGEGFIEEVMLHVLRDFCQRHPRVEIDFVTVNASEAVQRIADGQAHIGIALSPPDHPDVEVRAVRHHPLCVIVPANHALTLATSPIALSDAVKYPYALMSQGFGLRQIVQLGAFLERIRIEPHFTTNSITALRQYAKSGIGITFLSRVAVAQDVADGSVVALRTSNAVFEAAEAKLLVSARYRLSTASARLLEHLLDAHLFST